MDIEAFNRAVPALFCISRIDAENALRNGERYEYRITEHYEIDLITGGGGFIETEGEVQPTQAGMLFFRRPGIRVCGWGGYHCYHLSFDLMGVQAGGIPFPNLFVLRNSAAVQAELRQLYEAFLNNEQILGLTAKKCILSLLLFLYKEECSRCALTENACQEAVFKTAEYIRRHPVEEYHLQQLADHAHVSKYYYCRVFKKIMGEPPLSYANRCKVREAQRQLLETNDSIQTVMAACGYQNEAQFYHMFRQYAGDTPARYRHKNTLR